MAQARREKGSGKRKPPQGRPAEKGQSHPGSPGHQAGPVSRTTPGAAGSTATRARATARPIGATEKAPRASSARVASRRPRRTRGARSKRTSAARPARTATTTTRSTPTTKTIARPTRRRGARRAIARGSLERAAARRQLASPYVTGLFDDARQAQRGVRASGRGELRPARDQPAARRRRRSRRSNAYPSTTRAGFPPASPRASRSAAPSGSRARC